MSGSAEKRVVVFGLVGLSPIRFPIRTFHAWMDGQGALSTMEERFSLFC